MAKILDRIFSELIDNIFLVRAFSHLTSMGVQKPISRNSQGSLGGGGQSGMTGLSLGQPHLLQRAHQSVLQGTKCKGMAKQHFIGLGSPPTELIASTDAT